MKRWKKWTEKMDRLLLDNYGWIGDTRLAELFEERFPMHYPWTNKHIEKRRSYLKLKRTPEQESTLRYLHCLTVDHNKTWETRGRMKENEVREWEGRKYIKSNGLVILYNRFLTKAKPGQVARSFEGGLRLITKSENQLLNAKMRAGLPPELKATVKVLNQLKKIVYGKKDRRLTRNTV